MASIISSGIAMTAIKNLWDSLFSDHFPGTSHPAAESVAEILNIRDYAIAALIISVLVIFLLYIISIRLLRKKLSTLNLKPLFIGAWILSFTVYDVGMYTGQYISLLTNAPMAVIHAFESFLLGSDVSAIHEPFHNSWVFMFFFSASHALSAFASTLFLIKIFGFNIIQKLRFFFERRKPMKAETYILWGVNDVTYKMAASIKQHYENTNPEYIKTPPYRIIVVKTSADSGESETSALGFNKIFEIISLRDSELQQLRQIGCFIANSSNIGMNSLSEYSADSGNSRHDIIGGELKLRSLSKILECKTSDKIHILLLSDDEKQNLHDVSVLLNDSTLNNFSQNSNGSVVFYCHARYNGVHRVIEDHHCSKNMEVKVIDSSHINVELLKSNDLVLPVRYVDVAPDATVSSAFNAMVIGFSEVGQDATRFLYEFGAFVKSGGDGEHAERSDFHLDVVDYKMADKAGAFVANAPAISPSLSFEPELRNPDALIELHNLDCRSVAFYKLLEEKIKTLNYIVVATDDDELNMTMGVRIFRAATRYRANLDKLCILIRIHNDDDGHFVKIADYYNRLWASQDESNIQGKNPNTKYRRDDTREEKYKLPIYIFGQDKDVYTYDNIIDDLDIQRAIKFKEKYEASTNEDYQPDTKSVWQKEKESLMQVNSDYHPAYACVMRLRRTQGQDMANSLHWRTKELLREKAMASNGIVDFPWNSLQRYSEQTKYASKSGVDIDARILRFLTVMAQTEHLRWNASHEILGYVYDPNGKDEIRLHHDCLTDWENLKDWVRSYDNNVVDLTFGIIDARNKIKNQPND